MEGFAAGGGACDAAGGSTLSLRGEENEGVSFVLYGLRTASSHAVSAAVKGLAFVGGEPPTACQALSALSKGFRVSLARPKF